MDDPIIKTLYGTRSGRLIMKAALRAGVPKLMAGYLRSPLSKPMIPRYIRKHAIPMDEFPKERYRSFAAFFARSRGTCHIDAEASHLISPCDGWLSAFPIQEDSSFVIKGSRYRLRDLISDPVLAKEFCGGLCLTIRLTASDYHHYSFIDDGYIHESHYIEGQLHSVQPIACTALPVYWLNRRRWNLLNTAHFGPVVQVEVGAMAVGGIVNNRENASFQKGEEMGHFELCGSTIALFLQKGRVELLPEHQAALTRGEEVRVRQGMWIGTGIAPKNHEPLHYRNPSGGE